MHSCPQTLRGGFQPRPAASGQIASLVPEGCDSRTALHSTVCLGSIRTPAATRRVQVLPE